MQVLSRVLSYAVDPLGRVAGNPCDGIKRQYNGDRSEIIWLDSDIGEFKTACSPELTHAVDLAAHTGLRLGDLIRLSWSHVQEHAIEMRTSKSGQRREATKAAAGWADKDLHFHDLRGSAATKFYVAGIPIRVIAEVMGWEEETVEKIIRRYVGRQAATKALIEQINQAKKGT